MTMTFSRGLTNYKHTDNHNLDMVRIENNIFGNNTSLIIDLLKRAY